MSTMTAPFDQAAMRAAKAAYIETWVADHGTDSQRERLACGMLPYEEVICDIENRLFGQLEMHVDEHGAPRYPLFRKLTPSDICGCVRELGDAPKETHARFAEKASAAQWQISSAMWQSIDA